MKFKVDIEFIKIKEDAQYEYFIPIYPLCICKFNELEQKCVELKQCLPKDIVDVHVPTVDEAEWVSEETRKISSIWWTSTAAPSGIYAYFVGTDGYIYISNGSSVCYLCGFRPIIVRRK